MFIPVLCVSVMAAMLFALGLLISSLRAQSHVIFYGSTPDPTSLLTKAVRAHGNTAEFVPTLSVLILYLGTAHGLAPWVSWAIIGVTVSRVLVVLGFLTCATLDKIHPFKAVGAMGTYFGGLALCWAALQTVL